MADKKRLIDANEFWKRLEKGRYDFFTYPDGRCGYSVSTIAHILWQTESVDAVEVVRCKDCKHYADYGRVRDCQKYEGMNFPNEDDFCSYGERKDNG